MIDSSKVAMPSMKRLCSCKAILSITIQPYIDPEINYIRYFIKIPYINKGIEFTYLSNTLEIKYSC